MGNTSEKARKNQYARWVWISVIPAYSNAGHPLGYHKRSKGTYRLSTDGKLVDRPLTGSQRRAYIRNQYQ